MGTGGIYPCDSIILLLFKIIIYEIYIDSFYYDNCFVGL